MMIKITDDEPGTGNFISWRRLVVELFHEGGELKQDEHVVMLDVSKLGINYFLARSPAIPSTEGK